MRLSRIIFIRIKYALENGKQLKPGSCSFFFPLIEIYLDVIQIETYLAVYKTVVIHDSKYLHIRKSL